jgi:hypothetical protein
MSISAEDVQILTGQCQQFLGSEAPVGYLNSLALCIVDSVQSTGVTYVSVVNVVNRYRAYRSMQGGNADTDSATQLVATFAELGGVATWADRIGNGNKTSTHKGAPLKAYAIEAEAKGMIEMGIFSAQDLRDAAANPDDLARVRKVWLTVPGQGPGVTWHYVQMLAGITGIKPDRMIIRFVANALGRPTKSLTTGFCVEILTAVADELTMTATELDHAIWSYQRVR